LAATDYELEFSKAAKFRLCSGAAKVLKSIIASLLKDLSRQAKAGILHLDRIRNLFKSSPLPWALGILLILNAIFFALNPFGNVDPEALPVARNWVWWAHHEYIDADHAPQVVVLGSSVVMHPLWHHEANFRQQTVDLVADHKSRFLEDVIARNTGLKGVECFNFGLPGNMASDDYMVARTMFKPDRKPDLVIIGISPRDMIDNRFNCAGSSKAFQYLSRFTDVRNLLDLSMPQWWQRIGYLASESIYFSGKATAAQTVAAESVKKVFTAVLPGVGASPLDRKSEEDKHFAMYQDLVEKGFWIAKPNAPIVFAPDTRDLKKRYGSPNNALFENQKTWLNLCLEVCRRQGVKVVLANMPTSKVTRMGMAAGVYERHIACLQELSRKWDCLYVDVDLPDYYVQNDFTDCFHLSADGGKKAFELIGKAMAQDRSTIARLSGRDAVQLAGRGNTGI
jgi:hypothetical protein